MSTRSTKGELRAGRFSQDRPGFPKMGPAIRISNPGTTTETDSGFKFDTNDVLESFIVNVTTVTATSGTLSLGLLTSYTTGFVAALAVGTTGMKQLVTVSTSGSSPFNFVSGNAIGPLLGAAISGTTEGSTGGTAALGAVLPRLYALNSTTNVSLSYSYNSTAAFVATVYPIFYTLNS